MNKLLVLLVFSIAIIGCGKRANETKQALQIDDIIAVNTEQIIDSNSIEPIEASGLVASIDEARLSFKTGGIIEKIYVKEGQKVSKGQLLATLNLTEINSTVQQATESVKKAERDLQRITNLYADSVSTLEQVQNLTTVLSVAKQNLQIALYNRNYSTIHAPNAGTIVKKIMNEGELAGPGNPVLFMNASGANDWVLKVGLSDKDWARLKINDRAEIIMDAFPQQKFNATATNLGQGADPNSGLYQIELKINTEGKKMATGLFGVSKIFPNISQNQASISINSLIEGNNQNGYIYTIEGEKARKVPVLIDHIADGRVYLKNYPVGIKSVITNGSAYLVDGSKVKLVAP
ncbi:MAG: efflux RND transporter periplasmic adaptor subunit [Bacteroidota bacterium]